MNNIAVPPPAAPAINVLTAASTARLRNAPVKPSADPALKPNQPKNRMIVPSTPIGKLWPGIALADPSLLNRPMRAPNTSAPARATASTNHVHDARSGKVHCTVAKAHRTT